MLIFKKIKKKWKIHFNQNKLYEHNCHFKNNSYYTIKTRSHLSLLKSVFTTTKSQTPIPSIFAEIWRWRSVGVCPRQHRCLPQSSLSLYIELEPLTDQKLTTSACLINQPCSRDPLEINPPTYQDYRQQCQSDFWTNSGKTNCWTHACVASISPAEPYSQFLQVFHSWGCRSWH